MFIWVSLPYHGVGLVADYHQHMHFLLRRIIVLSIFLKSTLELTILSMVLYQF